MAKQGWEILKAAVSVRTGGLCIEGINHDATAENDRKFVWHVGHHGIDDERNDFSGCEFAPGAEAKLAALRALRAKG